MVLKTFLIACRVFSLLPRFPPGSAGVKYCLHKFPVRLMVAGEPISMGGVPQVDFCMARWATFWSPKPGKRRLGNSEPQSDAKQTNPQPACVVQNTCAN
jgi:hypothetical protein